VIAIGWDDNKVWICETRAEARQLCDQLRAVWLHPKLKRVRSPAGPCWEVRLGGDRP
jgi:hypothetical protein